MILLALALAYAGLAALCLAMERHHGQVFARRGPAPGRQRALRLLGWLLLALSPLPAIALRGAGEGTVLWCGLLTAALLPLALLLAYAPRLVAPMALLLGLLAGLA